MPRWNALRFFCLTCAVVLQIHAQDTLRQRSSNAVRLAETPVKNGDSASSQGLNMVPPQWIITNESAPGILARVATPQREILFTTIQLPRQKFDGELDMIANFCYYAKRAGAFPHLLIFTTDNITWGRLHKLGFPVYLDRAFPARPEYLNGGTGKAPGTYNRVFDVQKHWWGWKILEQDFFAACELVCRRGWA